MKGRMRQILHALLKVAARNAGQLTLGLGGCAPPPPPRPLSLDRQRKGGKKARPWRRPRGFCLRRATPSLRICPHTGVAGVAHVGHTPKSPAARMLPPGAKNAAQATPQKPHYP